jgi:subfamily B ATP-binding cassette protein HlyB/CyaB
MPRDWEEPGTAGSEGNRASATPGADGLLWVLGSVCGLHQTPFDAALLRGRFAQPSALDDLADPLRELGFAVRRAETIDELPAGSVAIAALRGDAADALPEPILVLGRTGHVAFYRVGRQEPETLDRTEFVRLLAGPLLLVRPTTAAPHDPDAVAARPQFSFRWFIPELLKHKRLWRNVLAASLAIQLLALGTPLFTQAIIENPA